MLYFNVEIFTCAMKMVMSPKDIFSCDIHFKLTETLAWNFSYIVPAYKKFHYVILREEVYFE